MSAYNRSAYLGGPGKSVYVDEVYLRRIVDARLDERKGAIVLGLACEGQILSGIIGDRKKDTLIGNIERLVLPGSRIVTDACPHYATLGERGWEHVKVNHSRAFHDFQGNTTNPIETYWGALKRNFKNYSQVADHNLWLFLAEFECRFNLRSSSVSCFDQLVSRFPVINEMTLPDLEQRFDWRLSATL